MLTGVSSLKARQDTEIAAMKEWELTQLAADHLLVQCIRQGALPCSKLMQVVGAYEQPKYEDFKPRTAWSLFNALTEVTRSRSPQLQMEGTLELSDVFRRNSPPPDSLIHALLHPGFGPGAFSFTISSIESCTSADIGEPMTPLDPAIIRRLAFVKYLFGQAENHIRLPEPMAGAALLSLHDAIELFLGISLQQLGGTIGTRTDFMGLVGLVNERLSPRELPQRESLRRLNTARNGLKHSGTLPSRTDLEEFHRYISVFLSDGTQMIFDTSLASVSFLDFIRYEECRKHLAEAVACLDQGDIGGVMNAAGIAYDELIEEYVERQSDQFHRPFHRTFTGSYDQPSYNEPQVIRNHARSIGEILERLSGIEESLITVMLGLDYRKQVFFKRITPVRNKMGDGTHRISVRMDRKLSASDARFAVDFVIECALRLMEFDRSDFGPPRTP